MSARLTTGLTVAALSCLALLASAAQAAAVRIEVFTIAGLPVTHVPDGASVVEIDLPARLDQRLSRGLPKDKAAAIEIVQKRLEPFYDDYGGAYLGLLRAWRLGVEQMPAVVVDGRFVVYGQPNVAQALATIREARAREDAP